MSQRRSFCALLSHEKKRKRENSRQAGRFLNSVSERKGKRQFNGVLQFLAAAIVFVVEKESVWCVCVCVRQKQWANEGSIMPLTHSIVP